MLRKTRIAMVCLHVTRYPHNIGSFLGNKNKIFLLSKGSFGSMTNFLSSLGRMRAWAVFFHTAVVVIFFCFKGLTGDPKVAKETILGVNAIKSWPEKSSALFSKVKFDFSKYRCLVLVDYTWQYLSNIKWFLIWRNYLQEPRVWVIEIALVRGLHFQQLSPQLTESLVAAEVNLSENKNRREVSPRKACVCLNSAKVFLGINIAGLQMSCVGVGFLCVHIACRIIEADVVFFNLHITKCKWKMHGRTR